MGDQVWFDDMPVVGELPPLEAAVILRYVGEDEVAEALEAAREASSHTFGPGKQWWELPDKPWLHSAHAFGYLPPASADNTSIAIQSAENITAEPALKNARVKITLDRLRASSYPGRGIHHVLVHFYAQNQIPEKTEDLHFSAMYRIREKEHAALRGYPVFVGLQVGNEGIRLRVRTINVKNDQDEALLGEVGRRFYHALFGSREAQNIVCAWQQHLNVQHRISIVSEIASILRLPWELLADPQGFLALHADHPIAIVRRLPTDGEQVSLLASFQLPLRVLLVTARPEGAGFVDPRSISRELVDALQRQSEAGTIELEFLRPPTFAALSDRLKNTDRSIHVLHFDGHGGLGGKKQQGVLLFEDKAGKQSSVEASDLAKVLKNSGVQLAVLTACQSAMGTREDDAFSSVSTQLINNDVGAVIAMSSSILMTSAALYVEAFYHALAEGLPMFIAQEQARQALQRDPHRHLFRRRQDEEAAPVKLSDWWVPHFYQQRPMTLRTIIPPHTHSPQPPGSLARFNDAMPPEPRYHFSGRSRELLQIERHLLRQHLVVLSGFGGVGKTALAREAADWFTRTGLYAGACFVSFEHGGDASLLLSALGTYLGVQDVHYNPSDPDTALEQLQLVLKSRPTLVIADNLESILPKGEASLELPDREQLWSVLRKLTTLQAGVLLTTRDPSFGDEQLAPSAHVAHLSLVGLAPDDAYALATQLLEDMAIPRIRAPYTALRDLLIQLDHHPLAIQLVLPTLREREFGTILNEFAALLPTFADDHETGRNRSLLASLDYSLCRLTDTQRALLPRLGLFEGGASEDDLLAITEIPEADWLALRSAVEKAALLTAEPVAGVTVPFLRFHPVLTPYLHSQFGVADPTLRERYTLHYASLANFLAYRDSQYSQAVRALVQKELPNLRRSLAYLLEVDDLEKAVALADRITDFLIIFGHLRERDAMHQRIADAIAAQQAIAEPDAFTRADFLHENGLGEDELQRGNLHAAFARFTRLLTRIEAQPVEVPLGQGSRDHVVTLGQLARCLEYDHKPAAAEKYLRQALVLSDALLEQQPENPFIQRLRGTVLLDLADVLRDQGQYQQARDITEEVLEIDQHLGDRRGQAVIEGQLGSLAIAQGNYTEAQTRYLAALQAFQTLGESAVEATVWHQLGMVAEEQHQWSEAERCYRAGLAIYERLEDAAGAARTCHQLATVAQESGRPVEAEGWYRRALELFEQTQPGGSGQIVVRNNLARLLAAEVKAGRASTVSLAEAKHHAGQALTSQETREESEIWRTLEILAEIAEVEGQIAMAQHYRRRAREIFAALTAKRSYIDREHGQHIALIATAARGDRAAQQAVKAAFSELEAQGWQISTATQRILAGERDWHALNVDGLKALLWQH